jgi:N-acetylmuramoyl-L-alanine amidase
MKPRDKTNLIVVHCSATPPSADIGAREIRALHEGSTDRSVIWNGNFIACKGWSDIGYHYVLPRGTLPQLGRQQNLQGAHVRGYNQTSLGICLVGGIDEEGHPDCNYTRNQWTRLENLVRALLSIYPNCEVLGHRDFPGVTKACPVFDVKAWWAGK